MSVTGEALSGSSWDCHTRLRGCSFLLGVAGMAGLRFGGRFHPEGTIYPAVSLQFFHAPPPPPVGHVGALELEHPEQLLNVASEWEGRRQGRVAM